VLCVSKAQAIIDPTIYSRNKAIPHLSSSGPGKMQSEDPNDANGVPLRRRSKRRKYTPYKPSALQCQFELAINKPGGTAKILRIVENASDRDIEELNARGWTPLVGAIFRLGKNTTKNGNSEKSERELMQMIRTFHDRGVSFNSGALFDAHYQRPLVIAAYFGYHSAVRLMIELGALPDLYDADRRNVWFAAFQNPASSGSNRSLRECDRRTARALLDMSVVAKDLREWRRSPEGSMCYMNADSNCDSVMYNALRYKNADVVKFFCKEGYALTDRAYLRLKIKGKIQSCLLPMVMKILTSNEDDEIATNKLRLLQRAKVWSPQTDWSFPPTWKVGVRLCQNLGLPQDVFQRHVLPFFGRDWFYTSGDTLDRFGPIYPRIPNEFRQRYIQC